MVAAEVVAMDETSNFTETFEMALPVFRGTATLNGSVFFEFALGMGGEGANMTQMSLTNGSKVRVRFPMRPTRSRLYRDMEIVDYYTSPLIVALGVLSNFLAYIVFTRSRLRKVASVPYLAAMAVTDSGALITDFIQKGLLKHNIFIISMSGICQFTTYFSYVFIFLSIWYPLAICVEKFICVYCPLRKASLCTPFRAKVVVISMAVLTGTCYYYVIYMYGPNYHFGIVSCSAWVEVTQDVFILMALDTVFACGVPCVILIVLVILIFARGCEYYRISSAGDRNGQGRLRDNGSSDGRNSSRRGQGTGFSGGATLRSLRGPRLRNGASASSSTTSSSSSLHAPVRVTNVIFPVVGMTLILQFPTFAFRFMFSVFKLEREVLIRLTDYQPLFIYMNNLAWAIKFYIYLISSPSFRKRTKSFLVGAWLKFRATKCLKRRRRHDSLEEREECMAERGEGTGSRVLTNRPINMAERWETKKSYTQQRTAV